MAITVKHKFVSAIPDGTDATIVRPSNWNDDHDLAGLGTIAEQNANTIAITGGTVSGTTFTSDTVSNNLDFTPTTAPAYTEGRVWYDSTEKALAFYNDSSALAVHVAQDLIVKVINNTGSTIANGSPVYITSTSSGQTYPNVALARADVASTASVIGLVNGAIANGAIGYVSAQGLIDNVNTGTFTVGQVLYLSPYSAGQLMNTIPPTGITVQVGVVSFVNSSTGKIYVKQTTPLAVPASIITGVLPVANGGTGVTTSTGSGSNVLNTSPTLTTPAITGGTIDNTVIGGTTPAAGTFTTITGQTEVLKGTGSNLLLQSNSFTTTWTTTSATIATTVATTDPTGGSNAWIITNDATVARHQIQQNFTSVNGITYTFSCYGKNNNAGFLYLRWASSNKTVVFNLSTGAVGTTDSGITASISNAGNGWYRCIATYTTAVTSDVLAVGLAESDTISTYAGTSKSIYLYGSQIEVGSTANTYIPTTTTAIYGTPTLSFSGVAGLGLQSDGSLYVSPAGTGALQAQATTSSTVGGNVRGANAVDWSTLRASATAVASGSYSTIGGGYNNTANGFAANIAGAYGSTASSFTSSICGGQSNTSSGQASFVGAGFGNTSGGYNSFVGSGKANTASGYYSTIGGGFTNSGTALAAVTTQSGTMNATTAVTLSGSNANIKVGQYITGTSIAAETYVAVISGTALTLSQNASGSSTSTLSFYTPHGVVVGGGNNQATGSYSFIGGGGDAGTAANRNVASGDWSTVGGGFKNTASNLYATVAGGRGNTANSEGSTVSGGGSIFGSTFANTASSSAATVAGGILNTASGQGSVVSGGYTNLSNATYSTVAGGINGTTRGINSNFVFPSAPMTSPQGASQASLLVLARQTTDATATVLCSDANAASGTNQVILPNNSAYYFKIEVIAGVTGAGNTKAWELKGAIKRGAGVGTTAIVGSVTTTVIAADAGASAWTLTATADTTNGGITVTATGQASTTIRWVARCTTTEMTY